MRKITLKSEEEKKKKTKQLVVAGILVLIMFFSVLGYSFGGREKESKKINYNGFEFVEQNGFWVLSGTEFVFKYNPLQVEEIGSELKALENYFDKPLYFSSESEEAISEIYMNLNQIVQRIQYACLEKENCEEDFPIKTCEDNFIIIQEKSEGKIIQENNCVFIRGPYENLTQLSDEFLFKVLGIRQQ